jgi:DNA-binding transcriptional ArsR family regulator
MSVAGLNQSIRNNRPLSERVVWYTLESHANGARRWAMSVREIAAELFLDKGTVVAALKALENDGIIRAEREPRRKAIFYMLRVYPPKAVNAEPCTEKAYTEVPPCTENPYTEPPACTDETYTEAPACTEKAYTGPNPCTEKAYSIRTVSKNSAAARAHTRGRRVARGRRCSRRDAVATATTGCT